MFSHDFRYIWKNHTVGDEVNSFLQLFKNALINDFFQNWRVGQHTPNAIVYGECGHFPVYINASLWLLCY